MRISASSRRVREISRRELEDLLLEIDIEIGERCGIIDRLQGQVKELQTKVRIFEEKAMNNTLEFVSSPEIRISLPSVKNYSSISGAYNPYMAGNKAIVSKRYRIMELNNQMADIEDEMKEMYNEINLMKKKLITREVPISSPFNRHSPKSIKKNEKGYASFEQCSKIADKLMISTKDAAQFELLQCVFWLINGSDKNALRVYNKLSSGMKGPEEIAELNALFDDRNAQATILHEQYKHFYEMHQKSMREYHGLVEQMKNHVVDNDYILINLKNQIQELDKKIAQIPILHDMIGQLTSDRELLYEEIEQKKKETYGIVDNEASMKTKVSEQKKILAGLIVQKEQLYEQSKILKAKEEQVRSQIKGVESSLQEEKSSFSEIKGQMDLNGQRLGLFSRAGINHPDSVVITYSLLTLESPQNIKSIHRGLFNTYKEKKANVEDTTNSCLELKEMIATLNTNIRRLEDRLRHGREALQSSRMDDGLSFQSDIVI